MAYIRSRKLTSGRMSWTAACYIGWDAERRKPVQKSRSFPTKRAATAWAAETEVAAHAGRILPVGPLTLGAYLGPWLIETAPALAASTIEKREATVRLHLAPLLGETPLDKLNTNTIESAYARVAENAGPAAAEKTASILHKALSDARRRGLIGHNPADDARAPRSRRKPEPQISEGDLRGVIAAADEAGIGALIYTLASSGARRGEVLALDWTAFDSTAATLRISRSLSYVGGRLIIGPTKTAGSNRLIYLSGEAVRRLQRHRVAQAEQRLQAIEWRSEAIFTNAVGDYRDPRNLHRTWARVCKRVGVKITLHGLRHAFASRALANGASIASVAAQLGHSSPRTTLARYAHAIPQDQRNAVAIVGRVLAGAR